MVFGLALRLVFFLFAIALVFFLPAGLDFFLPLAADFLRAFLAISDPCFCRRNRHNIRRRALAPGVVSPSPNELGSTRVRLLTAVKAANIRLRPGIANEQSGLVPGITANHRATCRDI